MSAFSVVEAAARAETYTLRRLWKKRKKKTARNNVTKSRLDIAAFASNRAINQSPWDYEREEIPLRDVRPSFASAQVSLARPM